MSGSSVRLQLPIILTTALLLSSATPTMAQIPDLGAIFEFGRQNEQTAKASAASNLRYTSDPQRRKANYAKAVSEAKKSNPALAEVYGTLTTQVDLYAVINDYLGKYGMRADDLGDVMALAWFNAYIVADGGRTDDPTKAQLTAIRAQLAGGMADLTRLNDSEKQLLADSLMLDMAVQQMVLESAKESSPKLLPQLAANFTAVNNATFNVDFAALTLGAKGFAPKAVAAAKPKTAPATTVAKAATPKATPAVSRAKGDYSHMNNILGVKYDSQLIYMAGGPAGYLNRTETTRVLFKDGTACWNCLSDYLEDPSLTTYRRENPDSMGKWVKKGQTYFITYPDTVGDPYEITSDQLSFAAPKGKTYKGAFQTSGGMTVGGYESYTTTSWSEDLKMSADGRFSWAKDSGFYGGSGGVGFAGSNSSPESSGRYFIDGFVIRFEFGDGKVETKSFVAFADSTDFFIIDGSSYWIPSD